MEQELKKNKYFKIMYPEKHRIFFLHIIGAHLAINKTVNNKA